jgi:amino acid transporter
MARYRQHFAIAAVALGVILATAGGAFAASVWNTVQSFASTQQHDVYVVMPGMALLILFGLGVVGDIAFRRYAANLGRRAQLIWRAHLLISTALLVAGFLVMSESDKTWTMIAVMLATTPLMLATHGAALAAGGVVVLSAKNPQ